MLAIIRGRGCGMPIRWEAVATMITVSYLFTISPLMPASAKAADEQQEQQATFNPPVAIWRRPSGGNNALSQK